MHFVPSPGPNRQRQRSEARTVSTSLWVQRNTPRSSGLPTLWQRCVWRESKTPFLKAMACEEWERPGSLQQALCEAGPGRGAHLLVV